MWSLLSGIQNDQRGGREEVIKGFFRYLRVHLRVKNGVICAAKSSSIYCTCTVVVQSGSAITICLVSTSDIVIADHIVIANHRKIAREPNLTQFFQVCIFYVVFISQFFANLAKYF